MKQQYKIGALMQHREGVVYEEDGEYGMLARCDGYNAHVYYFKSGRMMCFYSHEVSWFFISL